MRFAEKVVAVTGGGGGIGTALVRRFAAEGASVHCIDIDAGRAEAAAGAAGSAVEAVVADVTVAADVERALGGRVDVLVNNALSATSDNLVTIDEDSWRRDMDGTLTSAFLCTRAVLPGMIERGGGAIVNVASVNGLGYYGNEPYSAAKAGLLSLTGSVAARYGRYGVRANAVAPGTIRTAVWDERVAREPDLLARLTKWFPLGRIGTPDDVASCVLFLASDEAGFVTGATLTVDGGLTTGQLRMAEELLVESRDAEICPTMLDLCFRGARVVDGAGNPWYRADVGVRGNRITCVGQIDEPARRTLECDDLVLAPGFIDMHTHSDVQLLVHPDHACKVHQGVTLEVLGQDGLALAPTDDATMALLRAQLAGWNGAEPDLDDSWRSVAEYLERFDGTTAVNVCYLLPHATLRLLTVGADDRPATEAELDAMRVLVRQGLAEGAVGLSAGLTYAPGMYASDDELVELCRELTGGAYYCPHHRNYGLHALQGYADSIEIARRAGAPLHLAHAHLGFACNRGRAPELLALIDAARAEGVDITLDSYPYLAGATYLHALLPGWAHAGGPEATIARLRDPDLRERLRFELEEQGSDGFHDVPVEWDKLVLDGVSIADLAERAGKRPIDVYCDACAESGLSASALVHFGNEENVRTTMQHPAHTAGSDGILVGERPHPRGWGTFARYLAVYVRELGVLGLEECVRHMTSLPAQRLGLADRGLVRPGMAADITVFDADAVRDVATYDDPRRLADGFHFVVVNGELVLDGGVHTGATPGRPLRRASA